MSKNINQITQQHSDLIRNAEQRIKELGAWQTLREYMKSCERVLSLLYMELENAGASDFTLMQTAADFISVVDKHRPALAYAA